MSEKQNPCPKCNSPYPYLDGALWTCPECGYEFDPKSTEDEGGEPIAVLTIKDAHGNELQDGDAVTVIKDLKVKGSSQSVKVGTKVKNIRLNPNSADGHDISCKIPGFGSMGLKSEYVKKV